MTNSMLARCAVALALVGCDTETLDLTGGSDDDAQVGADATPGTPPTAPPPVTDAGPGGAPDLHPAEFAAIVMPILDRKCGGAGCHAGLPPTPDAHLQLFASPDHPVATLTPEQLDANLRDALSFVDLTNPDQSDLLRYPASDARGTPRHPTGTVVLLSGTADYQAVRGWIASLQGGGVAPGDAGAGTPTGGIPCEALPNPAAVRGAASFDAFKRDVMPVLAATCATGACHGTAGAAGGFWVQTGPTPCEQSWSFLATQWFVDPRDPYQSKLLIEPLEPAHGGQGVFATTDDPRYGVLAAWIIAGLSAN